MVGLDHWIQLAQFTWGVQRSAQSENTKCQGVIWKDEPEHEDGRERRRLGPGDDHREAARLQEGHRVVQGK